MKTLGVVLLVAAGTAACGDAPGPVRTGLEIDVSVDRFGTLVVDASDPANPCYCAEREIPRAEGCDSWHRDDMYCEFGYGDPFSATCLPLDCLEIEIEQAGEVLETRAIGEVMHRMQAGINPDLGYTVRLRGCGAESEVSIPAPTFPGPLDYVVTDAEGVRRVTWSAEGATRAAAECEVNDASSARTCMDDDDGVITLTCSTNTYAQAFTDGAPREIPHGTLRAWGRGPSRFSP